MATKTEMELPSLWRPMLDLMPDFMRTQQFQPSLNIHRQGDNLIAEAGMPGIKKEDVQLHVTRNRISLSGEFHQEKRDDLHTETHYGSFQRSCSLPAEVDADRVEASLKDGVLCVTMPLLHPEDSDGKQIEVK